MPRNFNAQVPLESFASTSLKALVTAALQVNQTFTIEPIFVEGSNKVKMWKDDWTATTVDGGLAAQCEHTILITPTGHEILTVA
jgi:methionine aminopeptidase